MPKKAKNRTATAQQVQKAATLAQEDEEWRAKNARAKAIIMSTLIPGSEPWKIAEPLELASEIWKALEDRYAPKKEVPEARNDRSDFVSEWVEGKSLEKYKTGVRPGQMLTNFPAEALMPEYNTSLTSDERDAAIKRREADGRAGEDDEHGSMVARPDEFKVMLEAQRRKEAQAAAARVLVEHMPNRDQRFLWALLHGGKEETMAWFNGTATA